jgi:hypothetical protein
MASLFWQYFGRIRRLSAVFFVASFQWTDHGHKQARAKDRWSRKATSRVSAKSSNTPAAHDIGPIIQS